MIFVFFFFQAEDGIRYLVRSRGLGDVYKRQYLTCTIIQQYWKSLARTRGSIVGKYQISQMFARRAGAAIVSVIFATIIPVAFISVSYTHLTLPTSDLV